MQFSAYPAKAMLLGPWTGAQDANGFPCGTHNNQVVSEAPWTVCTIPVLQQRQKRCAHHSPPPRVRRPLEHAHDPPQ